MAPTYSQAFCNNRGGVGKTFMAFQTACEAARARPEKKVLVIDFSLYSDISALLMGGSARESFGAPMKGLQVTMDNTEEDTRAEGLIRDLEHAMDTDANSGGTETPAGHSIFGAYFAKKPPGGAPPAPVDLSKYMIRPSDHNAAIPSNLYLVPSAGAMSWSNTQGADTAGADDQPLWTRKGNQWWPAARKLRDALDALPADFDAVMFDTDHLAACVLTKMALAVCKAVVVPLSFDDGDFNRLFQDVTGNALFTDVMLPMNDAGYLRAKVTRMVFTKVASRSNEVTITPKGSPLPFVPPKTVMDQMDNLAQQAWAACLHDDRYRKLFAGADTLEPTAGNIVTTFLATYFTGMKLAPDLAANMSKMNGLPLCTMTSAKYKAPSGLEGSSGKDTLNALKAEVQSLVIGMFCEAYNEPLQAS
mmetsp:Transcript_176/g.466  ORF Transcript_176/g.466 Transcript_176/m.466 type:complete len:418 (-) Transcript_176:767-2020(-)